MPYHTDANALNTVYLHGRADHPSYARSFPGSFGVSRFMGRKKGTLAAEFQGPLCVADERCEARLSPPGSMRLSVCTLSGRTIDLDLAG